MKENKTSKYRYRIYRKESDEYSKCRYVGDTKLNEDLNKYTNIIVPDSKYFDQNVSNSEAFQNLEMGGLFILPYLFHDPPDLYYRIMNYTNDKKRF